MVDPQDDRQVLRTALDEYPAVVRTLPPEYRKTHAPSLLEIGKELRKSFDAELEYVDKVLDVDATDINAVRAVRRELARRRRRRDLSDARTHCGHIEMIVASMQIPYEAQRAEQGLQRLHEILVPLYSADKEFLRDIEQVLDRALAAVSVMEAHLEDDHADDATTSQQEFDEEIGAEEARIRDTLDRMRELTDDLIKLQ